MRRSFESYTGELDFLTHGAAQRDWEHIYNHIRPHQARGYLTPAEFLAHHLAARQPFHVS